MPAKHNYLAARLQQSQAAISENQWWFNNRKALKAQMDRRASVKPSLWSRFKARMIALWALVANWRITK